MKIRRFNEAAENDEELDKHIIIKVSVSTQEFKTTLAEIKETEKFWTNYEYLKKDNVWNQTDSEMIDESVLYGLEEYIYNQSSIGFSYELQDESGDKIADIDKFKEFYKDMKNYNV